MEWEEAGRALCLMVSLLPLHYPLTTPSLSLPSLHIATLGLLTFSLSAAFESGRAGA